MDESSRIANISKNKLLDFYLSLNKDQLNSVLERSSGQEINRLLSHLNEQQLRDLINNASDRSLNSIFGRIPASRYNKYLLLASEANIQKIMSCISDDAKKKIFLSVSPVLRDKLLKTLSIKSRTQWKEFLDEEIDIQGEYNRLTSSRIENSIEKEALERIRDLELQSSLRQEQYEARIKQSEEKLQRILKQIVESEKELHDRYGKAKIEEEKIRRREQDLQQKIKSLRDEHEKQIQSRIDIKVPEYVSSAISALEKKEHEYKLQAEEWSKKGLLALKLAVVGALAALAYGGYEFSNTPKGDVSWLFFGYLMLKGLIVIGLFAAWAKHAFSQSNAYMHEALKRTERIHAISFGKLYLEIYGNDVNKQDMKSIFENWNMESQSAFKDIKQEDFQPKSLQNLKDIISLIRSEGGKVSGNQSAAGL